MLGFLFRGLTVEKPGGATLFDALTREARRPHWYVEGQVPDTLDGRFAILATLLAVTLVRLEASGEAGQALSVAVTERFIAVMESEHRELGLGDPTLGKTVRKLVGMLARRTELWRSAADPVEATRECLYRGHANPEALRNSAVRLKQFSDRLTSASLAELDQGKIA